MTGAISTYENNPDASWAEIATGAVAGGGVGAVAGLTLGGSLLADIAIGGGASIAGDLVNQVSQGYDDACSVEANAANIYAALNRDSLAISGLSGSVGGLIGHSLGGIGPEVLAVAYTAGLTGVYDAALRRATRPPKTYPYPGSRGSVGKCNCPRQR